MKNNRLNILKSGAAFACVCLMATSAMAISINDPGVVGIVKDAVPFGDADRIVYVNTLLGLGANAGPVAIGTETYTTSSTDYNGTVSALDSSSPGTGVGTVSGWDWLFVKYDGPNAGAVVWYLGGATFTTPTHSGGLWENDNGVGYGISGWTAYNTHEPPPPHLPDGGSTMMLLGGVLTALAAMRRKIGA